jgi:hypothetical protein
VTGVLTVLVPLDTYNFPGWPDAPDPNPLAELGLLIGLPLLVMVIAFAVAKIGNAAKASRTGGGVQPSDPIWMGGRARSIMGGPEDERPAVTAGGGSPQASSPAAEESGTGGAGARW